MTPPPPAAPPPDPSATASPGGATPADAAGPRRVALVHPGAMGASLGAAMVRAGCEVRWLAPGRSDATRRRADAAGLVATHSWAELLDGATMVLAICPPVNAPDVAAEFAVAWAEASGGREARPEAGGGREARPEASGGREARPEASGGREGWAPLYVDANAVAPATATALAAVVGAAGADFVDGDVVGPPAGQGRTVLYLSGRRAAEVAACFGPGEPAAVVLGDDPTAASALKMLYAGWTKASSALLLTLWAAAQRTGVADALWAEWEASQPDVPERLRRAAAGSAPKAWRFAGEMDEIARTLRDVELPDGFHRAASELYGALAGFKDQAAPPLEEVVAALVDQAAGRRPGWQASSS